MDRLAEFHASERARRASMLDERIAARLAKSDARRAEAIALYDAQAERTGWARLADQVIGFVAPGWAEKRQAERDEARAAAIKALETERARRSRALMLPEPPRSPTLPNGRRSRRANVKRSLTRNWCAACATMKKRSVLCSNWRSRSGSARR